MAKKRKKKNNNKQPKRTMPRERRLQSAKQWLPTYIGKHPVRAYAKRYHTDLLCSITELRILGVAITEEYEAAVKLSVQSSIAQKKQRKEAALAKSKGLVWARIRMKILPSLLGIPVVAYLTGCNGMNYRKKSGSCILRIKKYLIGF